MALGPFMYQKPQVVERDDVAPPLSAPFEGVIPRTSWSLTAVVDSQTLPLW